MLPIGLAGDCWDLIVGMLLLILSNCAWVVVGSLRRVAAEVFWFRSLLRGVDGSMGWIEDGVGGVVMLDIEDCAEWPPNLD